MGYKNHWYEWRKEYITESNKIMRYKDTPFTGKSVEYYDDDKTKLNKKMTYQDGKKDGLFESYYENGPSFNSLILWEDFW